MIALILIISIINLLLIAFSLFKKHRFDSKPILDNFGNLTSNFERTERAVREDIALNRKELADALQSSREEVGKNIKGLSDSLVLNLSEFSKTLQDKTEALKLNIEKEIKDIKSENNLVLENIRKETASGNQSVREDVKTFLKEFSDTWAKIFGDMGSGQKSSLESVSKYIQDLTDKLQKSLDTVKETIENRLKLIQEDNSKQLEQVRATVDEKLQGALEKRLGESFKQVSERLEEVYKGLGEMQNLAIGVGDLKKVLVNVKSRGTWGEVQLGAMLEEILAPEQFSKNVSTKEANERVEFAVKLPGKSNIGDDTVWLPIDSKFPLEDYQRLIDASEKANLEEIVIASKQLEQRIKISAKQIRDKYINPPSTTDFGILFLPIEGLYAEVTKVPGLQDLVQREYRVMLVGPNNLWALLNCLQMGFRTLVIQKRSSEVWNILSSVKAEWQKYGDILSKVQKKLNEASNTIDEAQKRTRVIGRKLKDVQGPPQVAATSLLTLSTNGDGIQEVELDDIDKDGHSAEEIEGAP